MSQLSTVPPHAHVQPVCMPHAHAQVSAGRRVVPTELGITLIRGYQRIDPELARPQVRACAVGCGCS
jgi:DNA topoisomerase-3